MPSQTKAPNPTPGLSSFLQVLFFDPLKPSKEVQHSPTLGGEGGGVLEGTRNTSTGVCGPALHQKPQQISHPQAVSLTTCKSLETPYETQVIGTSLFPATFLWTPLAILQLPLLSNCGRP